MRGRSSVFPMPREGAAGASAREEKREVGPEPPERMK